MRDYNDLVDGVVSVLEHWYRGSLDTCHNARKPTLNPREYISDDNEFLDRLISDSVVKFLITNIQDVVFEGARPLYAHGYTIYEELYYLVSLASHFYD